jgi:hypothetical protein
MKYATPILAAILVLVALWLATREPPRDPQVDIWKAKYAEAVIEGQRVADTVVKRETIVRAKRDTVLQNLTDTLLVKEFVYQTDTLRVACLQCVEQLKEQQRAADVFISGLQRVNAEQKRTIQRMKLLSRLGISCGYGPAVVGGGAVQMAPACLASVRVFP